MGKLSDFLCVGTDVSLRDEHWTDIQSAFSSWTRLGERVRWGVTWGVEGSSNGPKRIEGILAQPNRRIGCSGPQTPEG